MAKRKTKKAGKNWRKFWKLGADEFNTGFLGISKDAELTASEGHHIYNLHDLAAKYGTPLQVVFPFIIEDRLKDLMGYFQILKRRNCTRFGIYGKRHTSGVTMIKYSSG